MAQRRNPKATSYPKNHHQQQQHHHHHPTMDPTSHPPQSSPFSIPTSNSKQHHPIPSSILNKLKSHFPRKPNSTHLPTPDPPPPRLDSRFQPKSLTLSANGADLYTRKTPPHPCHNPTKQIIMDKQRSLKETSTRKVKKEEPDLDFNLKQQQQRLSSISLSNERRKSFGDAKIDLADFFFSLTARVVAVDMPPFMQIHAVSCARKAYDSLEDKHSTKNLACTLKKEFDGVYGPAWHCIVGSSFGSFVTHSVNGFFYFSIDHKMYVLLFKTAVERAD